MPTPSIRPAAPDDAVAISALSRLVYPYLVRGAASYHRMIATPPPGEDWACFVATESGSVVGRVSAFRNIRSAEPSFGQVSLLHVHPAHRRRGLGTALFAAAADHLRSVGVHRAAATTTVEAMPFARRFGFEPTRELRYSALDLRSLGAPAPDQGSASAAPDLGIAGLVSLRELDPRALYRADATAAIDEPGDTPAVAVPYETWRYDVWDNIGLDHDASTALLEGDEVVSFSLLMRDDDRVWSDMTATAPSHRGRGLARRVKTAALHRAAAAGATTAYTSNDESNAPMLAVNTHLGYRPIATQLACVADL